ncbi:MAG: hypothetical protein ACR2M3_08540, partial [Thermomicrobiales bacterium]
PAPDHPGLPRSALPPQKGDSRIAPTQASRYCYRERVSVVNVHQPASIWQTDACSTRKISPIAYLLESNEQCGNAALFPAVVTNTRM